MPLFSLSLFSASLSVGIQGFGFKKLLLGAAIYFAFNYFLSYITRKDQRGVAVTDPDTGRTLTVAANTGQIPPFHFRPKTLNDGATYRPIPKKLAPIWPQDSLVDIVVALTPSVNPRPLSDIPDEYLVLREKNFQLSNSSDTRSIDCSFTLPPAVRNNGTLWGHFYIGLNGTQVLDPLEAGFDPATAFHFTYPLTQYLPKKRVAKTRNLLEGRSNDQDNDAADEAGESGPIIVSHYHPNASFAFVPSMGVIDYSQLHPAAKQFLHAEITGARDGTGENSWYCRLPPLDLVPRLGAPPLCSIRGDGCPGIDVPRSSAPHLTTHVSPCPQIRSSSSTAFGS